tara:strand:+ start:3421 stop:7842 length:4422 start_codon:yes stop_codon:yes gene_type:complete
MASLKEALAAINAAGTGSVAKTVGPKAANRTVASFAPKEPSGDINFAGILGDLIDVIDTPRAAIASTAQEIVDVFQGEGFSPKDWWQQTSDNHMFGEVLRDSGVDLPGPLDFALGLGLDIATDPLTYFAGAGVAARLAKADDVVLALRKASNAAEAAGNAVDANRLFDAAERVRKTRSVLSAGKALDDIGMSAGARLTLPGTGRLGRNIIEKPLDFVTRGKFSSKFDQRRAKQLADLVVNGAEDVGGQQFVRKYSDEIAGMMKAMRQGDDAVEAAIKNIDNPAVAAVVQRAAAVGRKMPVETGIKMPWSTPLVAAIAMTPGKAMRAATQKKIVSTLDEALNTRAPIRALKLSDDPDLGLAGIYIERAGNMGEVASRRMETTLTNSAKQVLEEAKKAGISDDDLLLGSDMKYFLDDGSVNPNLPASIVAAGEAGRAVHALSVQFWDDARTVFNDIVGFERLQPMIGDLYAARFLTDEGADLVKGTSNADQWTSGRLFGDTFEPRTYVTPSQFAKYALDEGEAVAAKKYKTSFMGQKLYDTADAGGASIRKQMQDIGDRLMGPKFLDPFETDFVSVVERYIRNMGQGARMGVFTRQMEDAGIIVRDGVARDLMDRLSTLVAREGQSAKKVARFTKSARNADKQAKRAAEGGTPKQRATRERLDTSVASLEDEADELLSLLNNLESRYAPDITDSIRGTLRSGYVEELTEMQAQASLIGQRLEAVKKLRNLLKGLSAGDVADPFAFSMLDETIKALEDALTSFNSGAAISALDDETAVAAQRLLDLFSGEKDLGPLQLDMFPTDAQKAKQYKRFNEFQENFDQVEELDELLGASEIIAGTDIAYIQRQMDDLIGEVNTLVRTITDDITGVPAAARLAGRTIDEQEQLLLRQQAEVAGSLATNSRELQDLMDFLANREAAWIRRGVDKAERAAEEYTILQEIRTRYMNIRKEIENARRSGSLKDRISAAESQEEAIKQLNNERNLLGFQVDYNEALTNQMTGWFEGFSGVNAGEMGELFQTALEAAAKVNNATAMKGFLKNYGGLVNWWKANAVSTPGFVLRNGMGGTWMNAQLAGVEMGTHTKVVGIARAAMKAGNGDMFTGINNLIADGKSINLNNVFGTGRKVSLRELRVFKQMVDSGLASGGQAWSEVSDVAGTLAGSGILGNVGGNLRPWSPDFVLFRSVRNANEKMEFMLRGAIAFDQMAYKGKSIDEAWDSVRKYHFDYSDLTDTERRIKMVIPFLKWQKSVLPVLIESIGKNPKAWGRLQQFKGEMELTSEEEGMVPDYFGESLGIRLPFEWQGSRVYALPDLPFKDLARYTKEPTSPVRTFAEAAIPFVKLPVEIWSGKRTFADIPFSGRYQQVPNSYSKIPGLMETLELFGKTGGIGAVKNKKGEWKMRDRDIYILDQFLPVFGRLRRLFPNEEAKQRRLTTTWLSTMTGTGLRVNDSVEKRNAWYKLQSQMAKDLEDMQDIAAREV